MIQFEKVSFEQFHKDYLKYVDKDAKLSEVQDVYDHIKLPQRSTANAAGYDFYIPYEFSIKNGAHLITGIRAHMSHEWVLMLYPRSSLGIKHGISLANTTGVIDADYYDADNEGHIHVVLTSFGKDKQTFEAGERVVQGVFLQYGIVDDDHTETKRTGGMGSTGK